jgi:nucleotide-binding universal stress UspA family protein
VIRKILIAHDGSTQARKALHFAIDMAKAFDAELVLLHVISDQPLTETERHWVQTEYQHDLQQGSGLDLQIRTLMGRETLTNAEREAVHNKVQSVRTMLSDGDPASTIVEVAEKEKPDLLVLGSRGLGGIQKLLIGSVSEKVCKSAECTVVIVK